MYKAKYDNFKQLLDEVRATGGIDTNIEFVCHIQDLIGHSTFEDLEKLSAEYKETFYRVYDVAMGTEATIRAWRDYSNYCRNLREKLEDYEDEIWAYKADLENANTKAKEWEKSATAYQADLKASEIEKKALSAELDKKDAEILKLKARLYDLIG